MTAKSNFRLVGCAFVLSTIVLAGFIEIPGTLAVPLGAGRQANLWEKIVFLANGAWQKISGTRPAGKRQTRIAAGRGGIVGRTDLKKDKSDLVALIPISQGDFVGVTITDKPTFWFYVSPTFSELNVKYMTFNLIDPKKSEGEDILWSTKLLINSSKIGSGLMPITYYGDKLQADGTYYWELKYHLAEPNSGKSEKISGSIQKETISSSLVNQELPARLNTYARKGIWYNLITDLIIEKQKKPNDQQLANAFRSLIFESKEVKYSKSGNEKEDDIELMEEIVTSKVLKLPWSN
jgi:Domain of Unknown Function (DUF928)